MCPYCHCVNNVTCLHACILHFIWYFTPVYFVKNNKKKIFHKKNFFFVLTFGRYKILKFWKMCAKQHTTIHTKKFWVTHVTERERERESWHETHRSMMLKIIGACKTIINWRAGSLFKRGQQLHKTNDGHSNLCSCYLGLPTYLRLAQKRVDNLN